MDFQKAFVNFALDSIGIDGILKLMEGKEHRNCRFTECLSYYDGKELHQFMGKHEGMLADKIQEKDTDKNGRICGTYINLWVMTKL